MKNCEDIYNFVMKMQVLWDQTNGIRLVGKKIYFNL